MRKYKRPVWTPEMFQRIVDLRDQNLSWSAITEITGVKPNAYRAARWRAEQLDQNIPPDPHTGKRRAFALQQAVTALQDEIAALKQEKEYNARNGIIFRSGDTGTRWLIQNRPSRAY